jgi:two-component system cell cycle sensor histidine kinase/response regulator CckA
LGSSGLSSMKNRRSPRSAKGRPVQDRIRILHLEDNLRDAELIQSALEDQGMNATWSRVETPEALAKVLQEDPFDLIISDFAFPTFSGLDVLEAVRKSRPNIPFIFVSGTIGEERAVEAMRRGATDYVLKDKIFRLGAVVQRALAETSLRVQRRLAEEELHRVSEQLTRLLAASPAVIYSGAADASFGATIISTNVHALLGYETYEFVEEPGFWLAHIHTEDRERVLEEHSLLFDHGEHEFVYRFRHRDGSWRWLEDNRKLAGGEGGSPPEIIGFLVDITERKLAEDRRRESEQLFRILLESTPDMVLLVDRGLRYLYANPEAARILGTSVGEIVGKSVSAVLPADVVDRAVADLRRVFETGEPYFRDPSMEVSIGDVSLETRMVPIKNKDGEVTSVLGISRDVTDRKKAERVLRESEEKFRTFAEGSPNIIFISRDGRVLYVNDRSFDILGYSKDELLDAAFPWRSIIAPEFMERMSLHISRTVGGARFPPAEYEGLRKDGSRVQFVFNATLISYEGSPALLGVITDVSGLKKVESENAKIQDRLRQAEKMEAIGSLAGGVAHDFNNILMVILSYSDFLLDKLPAGGPLRREVEQIKKAGNRAAELTSHLLAFSRKQAVVPREIDPNEAVRNLHKMIGRLIGDNIRLTLDLQPDIGSILCDPSQFDQILINLVVNSRDAMPDGGEVTVGTRAVELDTGDLVGDPDAAPGHYIRVSVIDTGSGIPAEIMDKIFDPFFTTKPQGKGTGLGLSMVYGAIKQNKGHLDVGSVPGGGTTFHLYFNRIAPGATRSSASTSDVDLDLNGVTVLLVEDDESVREATRMMLEASGCTVIEASDGVAAVQVFQEKGPLIDVVLTDVIMPGMGWVQLGKKLREIKHDVRIIFCTGYVDHVNELEKELGETPAIITKPYERADLVRKIRSLLGDRNERRAEGNNPRR